MTKDGSIMSGNIEVAKVKNGSVVPVNKSLMPLYLQKADDFEGWLESRAIDSHRTNSRLLKKVLRLTTAHDTDVVLKVHAATITDNYWFKEIGSTLCYEDVKFKSNAFDKLALYGDPDSFNFEHGSTPELTNIGSYEKCWRMSNEKWWIYKQGNDNEKFSELFISLLGKELGFNMAHYEIDDNYIKSLDFTNGASVNYEPMYSLMDNDEDYDKNFSVLYNICPKAAKDYVNMIYLDTICHNMDRHTKNYGVLKDLENGKILGLAPNFDNNIALISRGYPSIPQKDSNILINWFYDFISNNDIAREYYNEIDQSIITVDLLNKLIDISNFNVERQKIIDFILSSISIVQDLLPMQELSNTNNFEIELS